MLSQSSKRAGGLINCQLLSLCRPSTVCTSLFQRGVFARYRNLAGDSSVGTRSNRPPSKRKIYYRNRRRNRKNNESQKIELGISTLGKPGEVLVVPERTRRSRSDKAEAQPKADTRQLRLMLNEVGQDTSQFDSSELAERIEDFRSPYQTRDKLAPGDWEDLRNRLRSSFTALQLSEYISGNSKRGKSSPEGSLAHREYSNVAEWRPGTSHFLETGPVSQETVADRIAASRNIRGKQLLVERVLRDCWHLGIMNEPGQLDIRLPTHILSLLTGSKFFSFEELANLHETAIDVTHTLGLIRVTGKQRSCESIREIVHDYTNRIRSEELNLFPPGDMRVKIFAQTFTPDFISWVSGIYQVSLEQSSSQLPIRIHFLSENQANADNARRTMNLALAKATSPSVPFSTYMPASKPSEIHEVDVENTAPWHDRGKSWFRWETQQVQNPLIMLPGYLVHGSNNTLSDELLKVLRQVPHSNLNFGSDVKVRESITATVGKCLFLRKQFLEGSEVNASQLGKMSLPRTFIKDVPRVPELLRSLALQGVDTHLYHIRLMPSALHASMFPPLELELAFAPNSTGLRADNIHIRSAKAVLTESNIDYLLPESVADIRFTRKLTHELSSKCESIPSLETLFTDLQGCLFRSMTSDNVVPLPTFTSLGLPNYVLRNNGGELDPNGLATAEYTYLPVNDVYGTYASQYAIRDQQLFHASYDSGPYNAYSTTDLFLQMELKDHSDRYTTPSNSVSLPESETEFRSFYNGACAVVSELDLLQ
ncbi:mitochondrial inner-membrane-bound regulator-domain-containing protein [Aspergillus aurantiobrunneus]